MPSSMRNLLRKKSSKSVLAPAEDIPVDVVKPIADEGKKLRRGSGKAVAKSLRNLMSRKPSGKWLSGSKSVPVIVLEDSTRTADTADSNSVTDTSLTMTPPRASTSPVLDIEDSLEAVVEVATEAAVPIPPAVSRDADLEFKLEGSEEIESASDSASDSEAEIVAAWNVRDSIHLAKTPPSMATSTSSGKGIAVVAILAALVVLGAAYFVMAPQMDIKNGIDFLTVDFSGLKSLDVRGLPVVDWSEVSANVKDEWNALQDSVAKSWEETSTLAGEYMEDVSVLAGNYWADAVEFVSTREATDVQEDAVKTSSYMLDQCKAVYCGFV